jgi:ABC-2 type transport system permease protein
MKLLGIARFEISYQLRGILTWIAFVVLLVFAFAQTRVGFLSDALRDDFFVNAPSVIASVTVFTCLIWLLVGATIAGEAGARDASTGMHPLSYTAPVSRADYLGGRFLAAFALNALLLLAVPIASILAVYVTGVDGAVIGPFRFASYATAWAFIALPNAFVVTAIQFSLAALTRESKASYLGSIIVFFCAFILSFAVFFTFGLRDFARLIDPLGFITIIDLSLEWTSIEKNERLLALEGRLLKNRLVWLTIAAAVLAFTHARFRFVHLVSTDMLSRLMWWRRARAVADVRSETLPGHIDIPAVAKSFGAAVSLRQLQSIAWTSFKQVALSRSGAVAWGFITLVVLVMVWLDMEYQNVSVLPRTDQVLPGLTATLREPSNPWMIFPLLIILFAGELVWRERDARMNEITDSTSVPDSVMLAGKFAGFALALIAWLVYVAIAAMLIQVAGGYSSLEPLLYIETLLGLQLVEYLLFAMLAMFISVAVGQKHVGQIIAVIAYLFIALSGMFGIRHNLLIYGAAPGWSYSDMRGFGPSLGPWLWFKLYWAGWALLLAVIARLLWNRGVASNLSERLLLARRRITRSTAGTLAAAAALIGVTGGFVFYNTNVLNEYIGTDQAIARVAQYELRYKMFEDVPQPQLTRTRLRVEIYPDRRAAEISGTYTLVNRTERPIEAIHATIPAAVKTGAFIFSRRARQVVSDDVRGFRSYSLDQALMPGDSMELNFTSHFEPEGFRNSGIDPAVSENGSYFTSHEWLPFIGYVQYLELTSADDRRKHGLAPRPLVPSLDDIRLEHNVTGSQGVWFDAVVGTAINQTAVAPGELRRSWTEDGRRYFHYSSDAPIGTEYRFFSARYDIHEETWNGINIRIYSDPRHDANVARARASIIASLDYFGRQFGPYPYGHLTFVERPGTGMSLHASPSFVDFGEGFSAWNPDSESGGLDLAYAAVSHEVAHQWWGSMVTPAFAAGAGLLSESMAWYSGMQVVKKEKGAEQLRKLRRFFLQPEPIPPIRQSVPLLRAIDPYAMYRKGPFAMWSLSEYVGEAKVNGALRRMVDLYGSPEAPLATSLDLYRELHAITPDSLQYLLHDLFEANTFWELKAERAVAKRSASGQWEVNFEFSARKETVDSTGTITEVPMDDFIDIGVYGAGEDGLGRKLYLRRMKVRSGTHTVTVTVPERPAHAGIDPDRLMISTEPGDNVVEVK